MNLKLSANFVHTHTEREREREREIHSQFQPNKASRDVCPIEGWIESVANDEGLIVT